MTVKTNKFLKLKKYNKKRLSILSILLISFILIAFIENLDMNGNLWLEDQNILPNDKYEPFGIRTQSSSSEYSGIGLHQNVTEYGQGFFQNNEINVTQNGNASIIIPNNWEANEILSNVTNIYEYDKLWMNETFDTSDLTSWTNSSTGNYENYSYGWYNDPIGSNSSIYMKLNGSGKYWSNNDAFVNYTFNLNRDEIPYKNWEINFNFRFNTSNPDWLSNLDAGSKLLCKIKVGSNPSQDFNLGKPSNYDNNTWYSDNVDVFTPELYDFDPPGTINVLFGIACRGTITEVPSGDYLYAYFDNITFNIPTIPKPSQINLSIIDNTNGETKQISDLTGYGKGTMSFQNSWLGDVGGTEHRFSFSSNSSGKVYIDTDFFVNATSDSYTTTELGDKGAEFKVENGTKTIWTMYYPVSIPGTYQTDYYFNISKPINWNVTNLIDPYENEKVSYISETSGIGNSTVIIPNEITVNGRWKIITESPNYVLNAKIWKWKSSVWEKNASFEISDKIKINATIDNYLIPDLTQTNALMLVYYPNGTLWSQATQELSVDSSGNVEFSNFTLGANNVTAGKYTVNVHWNDKNITQVGLFVLNFDVSHDTALNRANDQDDLVTPIYTGDIVLIKVNYTDIDTGIGIIGANVNYTIDNGTVITGDMIYFGGGIYVAEIDSSGLKNGIYNVSISANKTYYKTQYEEKLIQLEIVEITSLNSPQIGGVNAPWGSNVSIEVYYNDSFDQGISNAFIDCDWTLSSFTVQPGIPGQYEIILNTTIPQFGTYLLEINASKDGYENQKIFISINVRNIYTNLTFIQPDPVDFLSNILIQVEYGDFDNNILIHGADITISSQPGSQYWNSNDFLSEEISFGTYRITFNSSLLGGGTYGIYVTANKTNYANATTLINVFIGDISTYLDDIFLNGQNKTLDKSIIVPIQSTVNISVKYIEAVTDSNIKNATLEILGGSFSDNFTNLPNEYNLNIDTCELGMGVKILTILAKKDGYTLASSDITIIVRSINTTIDTESGGNLIEIIRGEPYTLKIVLKNEDFGGYINASVAYTWEFGHDELKDLDNNGVYEVNFTNIPEGNFIITITAYAGYDYNFEPFEITLIVSSPEVEPGLDLSWLVYVLIGSIAGLVSIFTLYQTHFKYPPFVRKIRKLKKKVKKAKKTKPIIVDKREDIINANIEDYKKILILKIAPTEKIEKISINMEEEV
ncbi:MAG: hypothetical protein V3V33_00335 [Candidatus Lokiarchaeia archaeon]